MSAHHKTPVHTLEPDAESVIYRKVAKRLLPFLFLLYLVAYLDRVNVGFAKLQMSADLGFDERIYGFGAGVFFLGYFLFEVPSNMALHKFGAKLWIARILVIWGLISAAMLWVNSAHQFFWMRFWLGVGEAGFFPGIILYLTYWFSRSKLAKTNAIFLTAVAASGIIGGPTSGAIMSGLDGVWGFRGWQWLFLLEGLPAVLLGIATWFYLDDGPQQAAWLTDAEKSILSKRLAAQPQSSKTIELRGVFFNHAIWLYGLVYFCLALGLYGISFWLPQIIHDLEQGGILLTGFLSAIPYLMALPAMVKLGQHSDHCQERRWHIAGSCAVGALGLGGLAYAQTMPALAIFCLGLGASGVLGALSIFWTLPAARLSGLAAAAGIALINSLGNLGGYFGPVILGWVKHHTGNLDGGFYLLAAALVLAGTLVVSQERD